MVRREWRKLRGVGGREWGTDTLHTQGNESGSYSVIDKQTGTPADAAYREKKGRRADKDRNRGPERKSPRS